MLEFLQQSAELVARGETFAVATVVRCQPPTSGKPGDKAIVYADGRLSGWIGGGCAQPVVIREALKALADGKPRLVRISPAADGSEEGVVDYTMTCHSGGALDIYIEPVLPGPHIVILGRSPVGRTLARIGRAAGYMVSIVTADAALDDLADAQVIQSRYYSLSQIRVTPKTYLVVSTQGEGDEEALESAVESGAGYVAFVASKTKAGKVLDFLREKGVGGGKLSRVRAPAGLNLGAATPEEIAVSILAEIVQVRRAETHSTVSKPVSSPLAVLDTDTKDPVCGMMVDKGKSTYKSEHQGHWFYFCCPGCKLKFDKEPPRYAGLAQV
jgi:xanthine dehydrogenase accessory factor